MTEPRKKQGGLEVAVNSIAGGSGNLAEKSLNREAIAATLPAQVDRSQILARVRPQHDQIARAVLAGLERDSLTLYGALRDLEWRIGNPEFPSGAWNDPKELSLISAWAEPLLDHIIVRAQNFDVRLQAAFLIGRLGAHVARSADILLWLAQDPHEDLRLRDQALASLGYVMGKKSGECLARLIANWVKEPAQLVGRASYILCRAPSPEIFLQYGDDLFKAATGFLEVHRRSHKEWEKEQIFDLLLRIAQDCPGYSESVNQIFLQILEKEGLDLSDRQLALARLVKLSDATAFPILIRFANHPFLGPTAALHFYRLVRQQGWLSRNGWKLRHFSLYLRGRSQALAES